MISYNSITGLRPVSLPGWLGPLAAILVLAGCDYTADPLESSLSDETTKPNVNIAYQLSYDEESYTYSRYWPEDKLASDVTLQKRKETEKENKELLVDYTRSEQTLEFDEDGNMYSRMEYRDGNAETTLPPEVRQEEKDNMPARDEARDPVQRREMGNGMIRLYGESGELLSESEYDPEQFRLDPEALDSLKNAEKEQETDQRRERLQQNLERRGVDYKMLGEHKISYNRQMDASPDLQAVREVMDLRTGRVVRSGLVKPDGRYESITLNSYKEIEGRPVKTREETLQFGELNGEWAVVYRTVKTRDNIELNIY